MFVEPKSDFDILGGGSPFENLVFDEEVGSYMTTSDSFVQPSLFDSTHGVSTQDGFAVGYAEKGSTSSAFVDSGERSTALFSEQETTQNRQKRRELKEFLC